MKRNMQWIVGLVLAIVLGVALVTPAFASAPNAPLLDDRIVFGGNYALIDGETQQGAVIVFGGNADLQNGSLVQGDVVVFGGNLSANGEIAGSLIIIGGNSNLGDTARVRGDLVTIGGSLNRGAEARIDGQILTEFDFPRFDFGNFDQPDTPAVPATPEVRVEFTPLVDAFWFLFRVFITAAGAVILVMFLPKPVERVADTVSGQPLISGGVGCLTAILTPIVGIILVITIVFIPVALLAGLALALVSLMGWIAVGLVIGRKLAQVSRQDWAPAVSAGVGVFLLSLTAWGIEALVPCIGWLVPTAIGLAATGAVLLTRLGTSPYPMDPAPMGYVPPAGPPPPPSTIDEYSSLEEAAPDIPEADLPPAEDDQPGDLPPAI